MIADSVCCGVTMPAWHFLDVIGAGTMFVGMVLGIDALLGRKGELEGCQPSILRE